MNKITFIFLLAFTCALFTQCKKDATPCMKEIPEWCHRIDLSDRYDPVCGCDGKTYQNEGHATCVGGISDFKKGACE